MPRAFSEHERAAIDRRLRAVARDAFRVRGVRQVTVEELARSAGISKGAFYLFYPSKEALFFAILGEFEVALQERLLDQAGEPQECLRSVLGATLTLAQDEPLLERLAAEDAAYLQRGLPQEQAQQLLRQDLHFVVRLIARLERQGLRLDVEPAVLTGLLRALFFVSLHRDQIGADVYDSVADLLAESVGRGLTGEG